MGASDMKETYASILHTRYAFARSVHSSAMFFLAFRQSMYSTCDYIAAGAGCCSDLTMQQEQ